jgi:hypothetical protein
MLAGLQRLERKDCCGYEQRVLWCWTEEGLLWLWAKGTMVLEWGRTAVAMSKGYYGVRMRKRHLSYHDGWDCFLFHIACMVSGIALCWCWQCLLTVGGNLLPHMVTPFDVTTVSWCFRQTQDVLYPAECKPALQTSEWQWTAGVFTTWHCTGRYSSLKVSVFSNWRLLLGITLFHCLPHCVAAELWCYLKCVKETTIEIK